MTDLAFDATPARRHSAPPSAHPFAWLYAVVPAAFAFGALSVWAAHGEANAMEGALVLLLRFMAGMKALMVVGAVALTHWRFRQPTSPAMTFGYVAALALMALAPGLIASLTHIGLGAGLFHAGLLLFLLLAWKDEGVGEVARRMLPSTARR